MQPLLVSRKDFGDGLHWWHMAFAAGYPDWLITSPLPPAEEDERWVWTGRVLMPVPKGFYQFWLDALRQPVSVERLRDALAPYLEEGESLDELMRLVWKSGLFVIWPWGYIDVADTPEAVALQSNMLAKPENPLPGVIPDDEWPGVIRMDRMVEIWQETREHGALPGGLYDTMQEIVRGGLAWFVAGPLSKVET